MGSTGSKRIGALVLAGLMLGACSRVGMSGPPATASLPASAAPTVIPTTVALASPEPTVEPTAGPTTKPTAEATPELTPEPPASGWPCPTGSPITVLDLAHAAPSCLGPDTIRVRAWLDRGPVIGWLPREIVPNWLAYPAVAAGDTRAFALWSMDPNDNEIVCSDAECAISWIHLPPDSTVQVRGPARWVIAIGHVNDPAAERCHWEYPEGMEPTNDDADAVAACRRSFVLESIEEVGE